MAVCRPLARIGKELSAEEELDQREIKYLCGAYYCKISEVDITKASD